MNTKKRLLPLLLLSIFFLSACMSENDTFIQGRWIFEDPHFDGLVGETYSTTIWTFSNGTFLYDTCCFNIDMVRTGRYRILEETENAITLELFNVEGQGSDVWAQIKIKIDRENNSLTIMNGGPFVRPAVVSSSEE